MAGHRRAKRRRRFGQPSWPCRRNGWMAPSAVDLAAVPDRQRQHYEPVVLDGGDDSVVADKGAPKPCAVAGQRIAVAARVLAAGDALAQIAQHPPLAVHAELAQLARGLLRLTSKGEARYRKLDARLPAIASSLEVDLGEAQIQDTIALLRQLSEEVKARTQRRS